MLEPRLNFRCHIDRSAFREHAAPPSPVLAKHGQLARALKILKRDESTGISALVETRTDSRDDTAYHHISTVFQAIGVCQFDTLGIAEVVEHDLILIQRMGGEIDTHQVALLIQAFNVAPAHITLRDRWHGDLHIIKAAKE